MINRKKELLSSINSKPYFRILSIKSIYPKVEKNLKKNFLILQKALERLDIKILERIKSLRLNLI